MEQDKTIHPYSKKSCLRRLRVAFFWAKLGFALAPAIALGFLLLNAHSAGRPRDLADAPGPSAALLAAQARPYGAKASS